MLDDLDLSNSADEHARRAIQLLLNLVETLAAENRSLREEIQRLQGSWPMNESRASDVLSGILTAEQLAQLDLFDRLQLERVLEICRRSRRLCSAASGCCSAPPRLPARRRAGGRRTAHGRSG